jgi:branched-subunit amino acid transport protein
MTLWIIIIGIGLLTLLTRLSFIALPAGTRLPPWMRRALEYVPASVLSAITLPELIMHHGIADISLGNYRLIAGVVAIMVAWRTRQVLPTLVAGMVMLWGLQVMAT